MSTKAFWKAHKDRSKVLTLARNLARSGQHASHLTILAELEMVEGFAEAQRCLTEGPIRSQIDKLCALHGRQAVLRFHSLAVRGSRSILGLR